MEEAARFVIGAMPGGGLFAGKSWRVSPVPFPLPQALVDEIKHLGHHLLLFQKAADLLYRRSCKATAPSWVAAILDAGKPPEVIAAGREKAFNGSLPQVIRPDLILGEEGFAISELDSLPGGIGLTAWLNKTYAALGFDVIGGAEGMTGGFAGLLGGGDIYVSSEASDYRPEMEWIASEIGARQIGQAPRVLDERTPAGEFRDGPLYRFFELFDLPNIPQWPELLARAAAGRLRLTPPPKAFLEEKLWLAFLHLRPLRDFWIRELGSRHFERLIRVVPRAWVMDPAPLPYHAELPGLGIQDFTELAGFSQKERAFALKISGFSPLAWGSRGVVIGQDTPREEWSAAVERALSDFPSNPWILQRFASSKVVTHPYFDEETREIAVMKGRVRLCPYYFVENERACLRGVLATIVPADKKLLHGMGDAILAPCAVAPGASES